MSRIKVVGYAKREFFNGGIEYRNFSPDLVGNQTTSVDSNSIFTSGNFKITTNLDGKVDKNFVTSKYTNFMDLENLNIELNEILDKYSSNVKLNLDYDDVLSYAYFGSLREYIRVSLENIIINWPASLFVSQDDVNDPLLSGQTVDSYSFNSIKNIATIEINTNRIQNPFLLNYIDGGTTINTFNETNSLRNLNLSYTNYDISNIYGDFNILEFSGASATTNSTIILKVNGNPFPNFGSENIDYHIKPNMVNREGFFYNLNEFENKLLNRLTIPIYTSNFKVTTETENGTPIEYTKPLTWPVLDGYNIEFNSSEYNTFVTQLLEISDISDSSSSNLMVRFLVSSSISEFDTIPDIDNAYNNSNGQKMTNALKIYGREFDEVKKYSDSISFANVVTYDKKNNTPDIVIKNLARVLGWQLTSSITQIDVVGNFLSLNENYYAGYSRGFTDVEAEIELWRRIILNTPWIWKSKGTRKAIEFMFNFIGAPEGLVNFNEYIYVAERKMDVDLIKEIMNYFNNTTDITTLNVDSDGFPKVLPNTNDMYFQKAGFWYRQTGGLNPDIDILTGNNPHIGPYDGGQEYINQFSNCLIPNFSGITDTNILGEAEVNLFTNYNLGTFNECCDSNVFIELYTNHDFDALLEDNQNKIYNNLPVTETGCTINNTWTLTASLTGETFYENIFFSGSGTTAPTETDYVNELYNLSGTTNLSGATFVYDDSINIFSIITSNTDCKNELINTYFKVEISVNSEYDCLSEVVTGLTSFLAGGFDNACSPSGAKALTTTLYHNGTEELPQIGDTIYYDSFGLDKAFSLSSGSTYYIGGDWADSSNWLQTDSNGVRTEIICPVTNCTVILSDSKTVGGPFFNRYNTDYLYFIGLTATRNVNITYTLSNIKWYSAPQVATLIVDGVTLSNTGFNSQTVTRTVSKTASGSLPDFTVFPEVSGFGVVSADITMTINSISGGDCVKGSNQTTITISPKVS